MSQRNLGLLLIAALICYACYLRAEQNPYARYVETGFSVIDRLSLAEAPDRELFESAMTAMVDVLRQHGDEHSKFVGAQEGDAFREEITLEFGGIGVHLRRLGDPPWPTVVGAPSPNSPAAAARLAPGDQLLAVDGTSTRELSLDDVTELVRGPVGEPTTLSVRRASADVPEEVTLIRQVITVESILGEVRGADGRWSFQLPEAPELAYLRITKFGDKTVNELRSTLAELVRQGAAGAILDVRDNAGGALDAAVGVCDTFLRAGRTIVTTRRRDMSVRDRYASSGGGDFPDLPLAILIDRNTASASEIVAACLQDYHRAVVVGERSFGKGTVQHLIRVESGRSLLKLTTATYWRPSGKNIHRMPGQDDPAWGVTPDADGGVVISDADYAAWRADRAVRDQLGEHLEGPLATELIRQEQGTGRPFVDPVRQRACEMLQEILKRSATTAAAS